MTDSTAGGTWSTASTGFSIAGSGTIVTVTGTSAGSGIVTYTVGGSYVTETVLVNSLPALILFILRAVVPFAEEHLELIFT